MFKSMKWLGMVVFMAASWAAQAQRLPVPVVDFKNIPVTATAGKTLSEAQVKQAFLTAGVFERWDMTPVSDGVMQARFLKGEHMVEATITYSAEVYSVVYTNSVAMKFEETMPTSPRSFNSNNATNRYTDAAQKQKDAFSAMPETAYAVPRPQELIHPFYEVWVRKLIGSINRQLKAVQ